MAWSQQEANEFCERFIANGDTNDHVANDQIVREMDQRDPKKVESQRLDR